MPFGLCNGPATFERLMDLVLRGLTWKTCFVYLDDDTVIKKTFKDHLESLREVLTRIQGAQLKLSLKKYSLFQKEVQYLGHLTTKEEGRRPDLQDICHGLEVLKCY